MIENNLISKVCKTKQKKLMMKKTFTIFVFLIMGFSLFSVLKVVDESSASGNTIYVDDDGGADYTSIQDAIDAASEGDTIYVYSGTYNEYITIDKRITLWGQDKETTIINLNGSYENTLRANSCTIKGFTFNAEQSSKPWNALSLRDASDNLIFDNKFNGGLNLWGYYEPPCENNVITDNSFENYGGIRLLGLSSTNGYNTNNTISGNIISNIDDHGIQLSYSNYNTIEDNTITNSVAIGLVLSESNHNIVKNNVITGGDEGLRLSLSDYNSIYSNIISMNDRSGIQGFGINNNDIYDNTITNNNPTGSEFNYGLRIIYSNRGDLRIHSNNNHIYHNTFSGNTNNAFDAYTNIWDNGYPSGGNYWDDYTGVDADGDGIGDIAYEIPGGDSQDRYPLGFFNNPPAISFSYDDSSKTITIVAVDDGLYYGDSSSSDDANLVFIRDDDQFYHYVDITMSVTSSNPASTEEIQAGDAISDFTPGTWNIYWKPYGSGYSYMTFTVTEGGSYDRDQQNVDDEGGSAVMANQKIAQSFTPTVNTMTKVDLLVYKYGDPESDLGVSIRSSLDGDDLTYVSVSLQDISGYEVNWIWIEFDFADITVNPGQKYYIIWHAGDDFRVENAIGWRFSRENKYPLGESWFNFGSTWTPNSDPSEDFCFITYGTDEASTGGWIYGTVLGTTGNGTFPLENALISVILGNYTMASTYTNQDGEYNVSVAARTYSVEASKDGYLTMGKMVVVVEEGEGTQVNFNLPETGQSHGKIIYISNATIIDEAIEKGNVGSEILIWQEQVNIFQHEILIHNGVEIKNLDVQKGSISFIVSGNETIGGKTIAINIDDSVFDPSSQIFVNYDGERIDMADDINDILDPNDDGSHPEYLISMGSNGVQLLVSIPHFSEHSITFFSLTPEEVVQYLEIAVIAAIGIVAIAALVMFRKGKED